MQSTHYDLISFVLASTILILLMAGFIVTVLYLYRKKQLAYYKAIDELKLDYEKNLLHTQLEMQEQTLQHVAREIHDNISLSLTLAKLNLNTLDPENPGKMTHQVASSLEQITKAISDLSDLSKSMNSDLVTGHGLIEVLTKEVSRLRDFNLFELDYAIRGSPLFLDSQKELIIFRIIQEAFNNIIRHAQASSVKLNLDYCSDHVRVFIADNGKGFSVELFDPNKKKELHAGLNNMKKRAALLDGSTIIESRIGVGTNIIITIPY